MRSAAHNAIEEIDPGQWNALEGAQWPFLRHEFLAALERTRCVGARTGWEPRYITLTDSQGLAAAAPAFVKAHSYGEFVFDFGWAQAYSRYGERYYPKLTIAVPFTPATGPRLLVRPGANRDRTIRELIAALQAYAADHSLSSIHALFLDEADRRACESAGWLLRRDCQFHWANRGYESFEGYLQTFTAEKRKKARRERRRVQEAGIVFDTVMGSDLDEKLLNQVYAFHRDTFLRHGREPYLTHAFFSEIARTLGDAMVVKVARCGGAPIATSICFKSQDTLYGRYWGSAAEYHSLHFETCYYQGIEYCIEHKLSRFEPGAQGEYKVSRGFEPALTWSAHFIADPRFRHAIDDYLDREGPAVDAYAAEVQAHVPYRDRRAIDWEPS